MCFIFHEDNDVSDISTINRGVLLTADVTLITHPPLYDKKTQQSEGKVINVAARPAIFQKRARILINVVLNILGLGLK